MVSISTDTHTAYTTLEASYWSLTSGSLISTYQTHQITLSKNQNQTDVSIGKIFVDPNRNTTKQNRTSSKCTLRVKVEALSYRGGARWHWTREEAARTHRTPSGSETPYGNLVSTAFTFASAVESRTARAPRRRRLQACCSDRHMSLSPGLCLGASSKFSRAIGAISESR